MQPLVPGLPCEYRPGASTRDGGSGALLRAQAALQVLPLAAGARFLRLFERPLTPPPHVAGMSGPGLAIADIVMAFLDAHTSATSDRAFHYASLASPALSNDPLTMKHIQMPQE